MKISLSDSQRAHIHQVLMNAEMNETEGHSESPFKLAFVSEACERLKWPSGQRDPKPFTANGLLCWLAKTSKRSIT